MSETRKSSVDKKRLSDWKVVIALATLSALAAIGIECSDNDSDKNPKDESGEVDKDGKRKRVLFSNWPELPYSQIEEDSYAESEEGFTCTPEKVNEWKQEILDSQAAIKFLKEELEKRKSKEIGEEEYEDESEDEPEGSEGLTQEEAKKLFGAVNPADLENGINQLNDAELEPILGPEGVEEAKDVLRNFKDKLSNYKHDPSTNNRCDLKFAYYQLSQLSDGDGVGVEDDPVWRDALASMANGGAGDLTEHQIMECVANHVKRCKEIVEQGVLTESELAMCQELEETMLDECGGDLDLIEEAIEHAAEDIPLLIMCRDFIRSKLAECDYKIRGGNIEGLTPQEWTACRPVIEDHFNGVNQPQP